MYLCVVIDLQRPQGYPSAKLLFAACYACSARAMNEICRRWTARVPPRRSSWVEAIALLQHRRAGGHFPGQFRAAIVFLDLAPNIDHASSKLPHVADILYVTRKHHHAKRAKPVVFAQIEIVDSAISSLHPNNFSSDTLVLANLFLRLIKRNAFREGAGSEQQGAAIGATTPRITNRF
jgi:hypothetical protein